MRTRSLLYVQAVGIIVLGAMLGGWWWVLAAVGAAQLVALGWEHRHRITKPVVVVLVAVALLGLHGCSSAPTPPPQTPDAILLSSHSYGTLAIHQHAQITDTCAFAVTMAGVGIVATIGTAGADIPPAIAILSWTGLGGSLAAGGEACFNTWNVDVGPWNGVRGIVWNCAIANPVMSWTGAQGYVNCVLQGYAVWLYTDWHQNYHDGGNRVNGPVMGDPVAPTIDFWAPIADVIDSQYSSLVGSG